MAFLKHLIKIQFKRLFGRKAFFVFIFSFIEIQGFSQEEIFLNMESVTLDGEKKMTIKSEMLFLVNEEKMVSHFTFPKEYYIINNGFGEAKMYEPSSNSLIIRYGENFKVSSSLIYSFFTNSASDLGMAKSEFQLSNSYFENQFLVTEWIPPTAALEYISSVKLVLENNLPVYCEYLNNEGKVDTKIYFSEYSPVLNAKFPKRITTLNYTYEPKLDSTTNRVLFKDLDFGKDLNIELKTFKIPTDASLVD